MRKSLILITLLYSVVINDLRAESSSLLQNMSIGIGMVNATLTESQSTLESEDSTTETEVATINPISTISLELSYHFKNYLNKSIYAKTFIPLMSSDGSGYYMAALGITYYLNSISSIFNFNDQGTSLNISPTFRYYVGGYVGGGYLVYNTETAKKSDLVLDLSASGGVDYKVSDEWSIKLDLSAGRLTGINTTGIAITAFLGGTYYLP